MAVKKNQLENCGNPRSVGNGNRKFNIYKGFIKSNTWLGEPDATKEWSDDTKLSTDRFVLTKSYEIFSSQNILFLFGRRGTGKTSILQMLNYRTNNNLKSIYSYSTILEKEKLVRPLTIVLKSYSDSLDNGEMVHVTKTIFKWIINVSAMKRVIEANLKGYDEYLKPISEYLLGLDLITEEEFHLSQSPIQAVTDLIYEQQEKWANSNLDLNSSLIKALKKLETKEFFKALNNTITVLNKSRKSCLVLVDSQERYQFSDTLFSNAITGLISAVLEIDRLFKSSKIKSKVAFPSEIVPHMNPENKGKTNTKSHFIFWQYDDIAELISKRYEIMLNNLGIGSSPAKSSLEEQHAIYKYIPVKISTYSNIEYDTLSYVINHTQKKPREVIQIFNKILSLASENSISFLKITEGCVREGTNAEIKDLSSAVLDMYKEIYNDVLPIVGKTFTNRNNIMTYGDMQSCLRETKSLFIDFSGSRHQMERLFAESGILGKVTEISNLHTSEKRICHADFEYQIKGSLTFQSQDVLAIHPMFYQEFNSLVYDHTLVIPKPTLDEQQRILDLSN